MSFFSHLTANVPDDLTANIHKGLLIEALETIQSAEIRTLNKVFYILQLTKLTYDSNDTIKKPS